MSWIRLPGLWFDLWADANLNWPVREYHCGECFLEFFAPWGQGADYPPCPNCGAENVVPGDSTAYGSGMVPELHTRRWTDKRWTRELSEYAWSRWQRAKDDAERTTVPE